jgi:hypothetical protein
MYRLRWMMLRAWTCLAVIGFGVEALMSVALASNTPQMRQIEQSTSNAASEDLQEPSSR